MIDAERTALIGKTGFVGGNLSAQYAFSRLYDSKDIDEIRGQRYDLVVCAGAPGFKRRADKYPDEDWASIQRLMSCLRQTRAGALILISTVAVYPNTMGVDEDSPVDEELLLGAYGRHRFLLERFVADQFPDHLIVRLPSIFGHGLKKNVLFDLIHRKDEFLAEVHADSVVQLYDLHRLWTDIGMARAHEIRVLNLPTEPLTLTSISRHCFGRPFPGRSDGLLCHYDVRTKHAAVWGKSVPYRCTAEEVMQDLSCFLRAAADSAPA